MGLGRRLKAIADGLTAKEPDASAALHGFIADLRATGIEDRVVKVGEPAPAFELESVDGRRVSLDSLVARRPVILTFYRGRWCPYCNAELEALNKEYDQILEAGANLVAISPQTARHSREFAAQRKLKFDVLVDPGNAISDLFGLTWTMPGPMREMYLGWNIDLAEYNGDDSWRLPIPGRFVVDSDRFIRYAEADPDYMIRPEPEDTLEYVRRMTAARLTAGVQDADVRGHDRREVERRFRAERRQEQVDIDFPDRRAGEDRRTGERRSGEDRRER